jgi:nitric oxide reductase NorQ protein
MKPALHAIDTVPSFPLYTPTGNECALFEHAFRHRLPVLLKGPTGCGKTRFVAHMAARLGLPLHTVACHDDLTAAAICCRAATRCGPMGR